MEKINDWKLTGIGTEETQKLEPKLVRINKVDKVTVNGTGKNLGKTYEKVILECAHPDRAEPISISDVKYISGEKLETRAMWFILDSKGEIQKASALANMLRFYKVGNLFDLVGVEVQTAIDEKGYLCVRAY